MLIILNTQYLKIELKKFELSLIKQKTLYVY